VPTARHPDHITLAVRDKDAAIETLGHFGFRVDHVARIDGGVPAEYMGMPDMHADHITLALEGSPRFEIQLLHFEPEPGGTVPEPSNHERVGFNHLALRVDDLDEMAAHLEANGVRALNEAMSFIGRRLQFFEGPEGATIELVEWLDVGGAPGS
jgi:catechol 2,3-dioxygenase-like lactoylglutathione lyase family enzyme